MDAVQACRQYAAQLWRGDRTHMFDRVGGLVGESAVRTRVKMLTGPLVNATDLGGPARSVMASIDLQRDDPLSLLEKTEQMIRLQLPGDHSDSHAIEAISARSSRRLAMSLVVQSLAGRLGVWATRDEEIEDARIGRRLAKLALVRDDLTRGAMLEAAQEFYGTDDLLHVVACLLGADRLRRSIDGLFKAAVVLWKLDECAQALWVIRACLLEEVQHFAPETLLLAQRTESLLRLIVERGSRTDMGDSIRAPAVTLAFMERAAFRAVSPGVDQDFL